MVVKKAICAAFAVCLIFFLSACSFTGISVTDPPQKIYKEYIEPDISDDADYPERISAEQSGCVVSVISSGAIRVGRNTLIATNVFSGVVFSRKGYILTTSKAYNMDIDYEGRHYSGIANEVYAVLSDIYNDQRQYRLVLVNSDETAGLAVFRFYDSFSYYDKESSGQKEGLQFCAKFSGLQVEPGDACTVIGNSLGNVFGSDSENFLPETIGDLTLAVNGGYVAKTDYVSPPAASVNAVSEEQMPTASCRYILVSAAVNLDMYGGAVFDKNGYLIGIPAEKFSSADSIYHNLCMVYPVEFITAYINSVSEEMRITMPYIIAGPEGVTE